jgi:hypothetical protein
LVPRSQQKGTGTMTRTAQPSFAFLTLFRRARASAKAS